MLHAVREQRPSYNNDVRISSHVTVSKLKLLYYQGFASLFYLTGLCTDMVCVNSSWTLAHIKSLWKMQFKSDDVDNEKNMQKTTTQLDRRRLTLVYPPCNTSHLQHYKPNPDYEQMLCKLSAEIPSQQKVTSSKVVYDGVRDSKEEILQSLAKKTLIISIGQFRPEKDHMLQVRIMEEFLKKQQPSSSSSNKEEVMLVMLGSTRHEEDEALVRQLQAYIEAQSTVTLALAQHVHIYTNLPYDMLTFVLFQSRIGLHTMWNEHFGISVVEMMAAGLLMIAHNSGGPKADIVQHGQNGYLATAPEEYADIIVEILKKHPEENRSIQEQAKISATRYSDEVFASKMNHEFSRFLAL